MLTIHDAFYVESGVDRLHFTRKKGVGVVKIVFRQRKQYCFLYKEGQQIYYIGKSVGQNELQNNDINKKLNNWKVLERDTKGHRSK